MKSSPLLWYKRCVGSLLVGLAPHGGLFEGKPTLVEYAEPCIWAKGKTLYFTHHLYAVKHAKNRFTGSAPWIVSLMMFDSG